MTVRAIANKGSTKSLSVTMLVEQIRGLCVERKIQPNPHNIPGKLNVLTDALAQNVSILRKSELYPDYKRYLSNQFSEDQIDLMAALFSTLFPNFISPFLHP